MDGDEDWSSDEEGRLNKKKHQLCSTYITKDDVQLTMLILTSTMMMLKLRIHYTQYSFLKTWYEYVTFWAN